MAESDSKQVLLDDYQGKLKRMAIKTYGITMAGAALSIAHDALSRREAKRLVPAETREPFTTGHLSLIPVLTEHDRKASQMNFASVSQTLNPFAEAVLEYFPPEYKSMEASSNPLVKKMTSEYDDANYLFEELSLDLLNKGKKVFVLDPAYTADFGILRAILESPERLAAFGIMFNLIAPGEKGFRKVDRRTFLKGAALGAARLGMAAVPVVDPFRNVVYDTGGENPNIVPSLLIEREFRYIVVAAHLLEMGQTIPDPKSMPIVYPILHWERIQNKLQHPAQTSQTYERAFNAMLKLNPAFNVFFSRREYEGLNGQWANTRKTPLIPAALHNALKTI